MKKFSLLGLFLFINVGMSVAADDPAKTPPRAITASTDLLSFECLEGLDNHGRATVKKKDEVFCHRLGNGFRGKRRCAHPLCDCFEIIQV